MNQEELDELINDCPTLFHMAEDGAWENISKEGLLSTTALLDRYGVAGEAREVIETRHRPTMLDINEGDRVVARVRDQLPMTDGGLLRALPSHLTPAQWYSTLNSKVFFWLTWDRLNRLLGAKAYREKPHQVLELDTAAVVADFRERIWLCPINSGCTKPFPRQRDETTFQRICSYPYAEWKRKRRPGERVVELAVDYSVPEVSKYTRRVSRYVGTEPTEIIWEF